MGLSDSLPDRPAVMYSHGTLVASASARQGLPAPRPIFPRALSPTTPEGPVIAYACCFTTGLVWLHPSRADWPPSYSYRGRIGFTCVTARVFTSRVLASFITETRARLATCRTGNYMVNSFQFTRSARLILAYPTNGRRHPRSGLRCFGFAFWF